MAEIPKAIEAGVFRQVAPVLIVDDDTDWGQECAFALRQMGYEPFVASSAEEALVLFREHDISIAIVDYNLPGLDGITLIGQLAQHADEQGRQLRFIMATGHATKDVAIDAMRASAVDFLEKPISQADLRRALQRIQGLPEANAPRKMLLDRMSTLSTELQRLSYLMDEPVRPASGPAAIQPAPAAPAASAGTAEPIGPGQLTGFIRDLLRKEMKRREIGGGELFGDPTWAMLLDLLLAKIEARRVSVSSACIASGAPMSTALRLVRRLVDEGVLRRLPDEQDRRRHFLAIDPKFEQPLVDYLSDQLRQQTA
ncbi:response regulator [Novosphingobium resinovorum]|uniref:response regulator n=1 Tax=Novosphingobium resinovorum TaxID=158500 RepID=UPI002ED1CA44|nr:response regulator [Novosphingobium resinovorum]